MMVAMMMVTAVGGNVVYLLQNSSNSTALHMYPFPTPNSAYVVGPDQGLFEDICNLKQPDFELVNACLQQYGLLISGNVTVEVGPPYGVKTVTPTIQISCVFSDGEASFCKRIAIMTTSVVNFLIYGREGLITEFTASECDFEHPEISHVIIETSLSTLITYLTATVVTEKPTAESGKTINTLLPYLSIITSWNQNIIYSPFDDQFFYLGGLDQVDLFVFQWLSETLINKSKKKN